jgi:DNA primase
MNREFIDFLKNKISILDVISGRMRLRKSGRDWFGLCPFHKEKTASFKVDADAGYYHCFGCGVHGDVIGFIRELEKVNFAEAVEYLAVRYGISIPGKKENFTDNNRIIYAAMDEIKDWFRNQLNDPTGTVARKYLESRKISKDSIGKFCIGYAPDNNNLAVYLREKGFPNDVLLKTGVFNQSKRGNELINRYNSRLMFPILDAADRCVGFGGRILGKSSAAKYINSPEMEIFIKSNHLYGYHLAKRGKTKQIILAEGYLDVISMHQAGFDGTAAPLGTSISETQINMCWRICDNPIIALDGDTAGIKASYRWVDKILSTLQAGKSFSFAKLPQGTDPDSLIAGDNAEIVRAAIKNTIPLSEWIWEGAFSLYSSETPEQKAAIIKMIFSKIDGIKNNSIKRFYIQAIREKEYNLYRKKFTKSNKKNDVQPVISVREKLEKIFIVTIINHPYIMDVIVENFAKVELSNPQMKEMKEHIFDFYGEYLKNHDSKKYLTMINDLKLNIDGEDVIFHAEFSSDGATDEEAADGWMKLWEKYSVEHTIASDLQIASSSLRSNFSENDWQRLKSLKKETISNLSQKQERK